MTNRFIQFQRTSSIELADVEVMKPPTAARIDPAIEIAMKELVDKYRPVRQRTVWSETTRDRAEALSPNNVLHSTSSFQSNVPRRLNC